MTDPLEQLLQEHARDFTVAVPSLNEAIERLGVAEDVSGELAPAAFDLERDVASAHRLRPRRAWLAMGVAAAAVVAAVAVGFAVSNARPTPAGQPTVGAAISPVPTPAGDTRISYHGLTVFLPQRFDLVTTAGCSLEPSPATPTVRLTTGGPTFSCPAATVAPPPSPGPDAVSLAPYQPSYTAQSRAAQLGPSQITVDGITGYRLSTTEAALYLSRVTDAGVVAITLPGPGVFILVEGPDREAVADALLASARIAPVDDLGCAAQLADPALAPAPRAGSLVPGRPTSGVICQYSPGPTANGGEPKSVPWLNGSAELTDAQIEQLASYLNHRPPAAAARGAGQFSVQYRLRYADGSLRVIAAEPTGYPATATDGHRAVGLAPYPGCQQNGRVCEPTGPLPLIYAV